jgi:hypothetical protein
MHTDAEQGRQAGPPTPDDTVLVAGLHGGLDDTVLRPRPGAGTGPATVDAGRAGSRTRPAWAVRVAGAQHELTAPLVVGRRPSAPRVVAGVRPVLVAVESPGGLVSSSHVRVEQVGDVVVVTDLRSTNGTSVRAPGRVPVSLRQGESVTASAGTIVDVGDGVLLEILSHHRVPSQEDHHS